MDDKVIGLLLESEKADNEAYDDARKCGRIFYKMQKN